MNEEVDDKRRTNRLVHQIAKYLTAENPNLSPDAIYSLCQLTWWSKSSKTRQKNKSRLLGDLFGNDFDGVSVDHIAKIISEKTRRKTLRADVLGETGFTRLYNAYRASSLPWLRKNVRYVRPLVLSALDLKTDQQGEKLIAAIEKLPQIPGAGAAANRHLTPLNLLTPLLFALDPRLRFPIMNGDKQITRFLTDHGVGSQSAIEKYRVLVGLYEGGQITDAAQLDCMLRSQTLQNKNALNRAFKQTSAQSGGASERFLGSKVEEDYSVLVRARSEKAKRIHNKITNQFASLYCEDFEIVEGPKSNMFDIVVRNFNHQGSDLLIEAKSSTSLAEIRMAIGQLYSYAFRRKTRRGRCRLAVLLPEKPDQEILDLLKWCDIGLLWMNKTGCVDTSSAWLRSFCEA